MKKKVQAGAGKEKAQAALEYLMSYGWALVIIAVVVGVLIFMGIIKIPGFSTAVGLEKIAYEDHTVDSSGNFVLYLLNGTGDRMIDVSAVGFDDLSGSCVPGSPTVNAADDFNIYCSTALSQGQTYKGTVEITYTTKRGAVHTETAALSGTALYTSTPIPNVPPQTALLNPNGGQTFWSNGPKVIIKFTVQDMDDLNPTANIYTSLVQGAKQQLIVQSLNLQTLAQTPQPDRNCSGTDFSTTQTCYYDWNSTGISTTGNYYIDLIVSDEAASDEDSSDSNFFHYKYLATTKFDFSGGSDYITGNMQALARSNDGSKIYFVYGSGQWGDAGSEVYFMQSDDNGSTWASANISNNSVMSARPTITVDGNNIIRLAWIDDDGGYYTMFYSQCSSSCTNSANWSAPVIFEHQSDRPTIAVLAGTVYLAYDWKHFVSGEGWYTDIMYRTCSSNCGNISGWSSADMLYANRSNAKLIVESNGAHHLTTWDGNNDIMYKTCTADCNKAASWSTDVNVSTGAVCTYGRHKQYMVQDNSGGIHVSFDCTWAGVRYRNCASGCSNPSNWSSLMTITASSGGAARSSMAVDSDNNVYVTWHGATDVFYRRYNSASASLDAAVNLTNNSLAANFARANPDANATSALGKLDIVWQTGPDVSGDYNLSFYTKLLKGG